MHRVLARQLRRVGLTLDQPPEDISSWKRFIQKVESAYEEADRNRYLLERSLEVSSRELLEANDRVQEQAQARIDRLAAHYRDLFRQTRVPTWEENFSVAAARLERLRSEGVEDIEAHLTENRDVLREIVTTIEVTDANPAVAELVRSDNPDDLIGPVDPSLVDDQNTPAWIAQLKTIWDGGGSVRVDDLIGSRMDGEVFHGILEWHAPRIRGTFDYSRVVVSIIDITDRVEAEMRMQEVLKSKDEFLASISHELRTPLTSVLGFAEVLRSMEDGDDEERGALLEIIASQAADLSNIVEDLLVAARAELGQLTVMSVSIDVHAQVAQVIEGRQMTGQKIRVPPRPESPIRAKGDPERVRQVLRNLLTNAERYGGDDIWIDVSPDDGVVYVRVCDNGRGLPGEVAERVFERYYRTDPAGGQPGAVGIGLTISRDLAEMMGGGLYYERVEGHTAFTLELKTL